MDWLEESELVRSAHEWVTQVRAHHAEGNYDLRIAAPVDEVTYLLDFRREALAKIDRLLQRDAHLQRIAEANPSMRIVDALAVADRRRSGEPPVLATPPQRDQAQTKGRRSDG